jgi:cytochrome P450
MQCYTTHRDPRALREPERFDPDRWLEPQVLEKTQEMNDLFKPFLKGTRACLGKNLALMDLKQVVATAIKEYRIALGDIMKPSNMNMMGHFLAVPRSGKCDLVFTKI